MKLNKEQIQEIEYALNKRGLDYIDLKYELIDHIATDIEQLIESNEGISFDEASKYSFDKWNGALKNSSSLWLGFANYIPTILLEKCKDYVKRYELTLIVGALFMAILLYLIKEDVLELIKEFDYIVGGLYFLYTFVIIGGIIAVKKLGYNTTHSYFFKLKSSPFLLILFQFNNLIFGDSFYYEGTQAWIHIMNLSIHIMLIVGGGYMVWILKSHFKYQELQKTKLI